MVGCMILGMALPTVATYLVGVILFVPCIQSILLQSGLPDATAQLELGTYFLAVMVAGFFRSNLNLVERTLLFVAALCLIAPEMISSIIGAVLGVAILFISGRKTKSVTA